MGTPQYASIVLEKLHFSGFNVVACFTQTDKPVGRNMKLTAPPVKHTAEAFGIPVFQPSRLRDPNITGVFESLAPDLIVTAAYGKILPSAILEIPKFGCLNVHGSLLPRYRGAAPIQRAILEGETKTGVTIIRMDEGIDTGPMLVSAECVIGPDEGVHELTERLAFLGAELLIQNIGGYLDGSNRPIPQDEQGATYAPPIDRNEGRIDWNRSAWSVHNQIRALAEWPGAFSVYRGKRIKIYCSEHPRNSDDWIDAYRESFGDPEPGTVICARKGILAVMCGDAPLLLTCIQPESCKRLAASECAHNFSVADRFGGEG